VPTAKAFEPINADPTINEAVRTELSLFLFIIYSYIYK